MLQIRRILILALVVLGANAWSQSINKDPSIGYIYPGGARQGVEVEVSVGGQFLKGVNKVIVSGDGVIAEVVRHVRPLRNLDPDQRKKILGQLQSRMQELVDQGEAPKVTPHMMGMMGKGKGVMMSEKKMASVADVELPAHPLVENIDSLSFKELQNVVHELFRSKSKKQKNRQIDEMAVIRVTVDKNAEPGMRELRLRTAWGLTNPLRFQIGNLPEVNEQEPNDPNPLIKSNKDKPLDLPVVLNGQIKPGDIDRFRIRAKKGQQLVMEVHARSLIPYLADAVPGWFQATLALYDSKGNEMAFADDYRFNPDPVLFYEIPKDGVYELEIHDSIYRGREDFVYRISVGETPFITGMYPLGGRAGETTKAWITGWNLSENHLMLDTSPGADGIRHTALRKGKLISNSVAYAVDDLPECEEVEPNDDNGKAQRVSLPLIINGYIAQPGDVDVFEFEGRAGDEVTAEIMGRRLNSPIDSLLRLTDASGEVLEWNDDFDPTDGHLRTGMGLVTHHADSYLRVELPKNGTYCLQVSDTQNHGGPIYGYRLRLAPPEPDFDLRITPSSISAVNGQIVPVRVHAARKDGFDGDINVVLKNAPNGFSIQGGRIPSGRNSVRMTLTTPKKAFELPIALTLEGRAKINGKTVRRPVVPADDVTQAFLYRHLVPSNDLLVSLKKNKFPRPTMELATEGPVKISNGEAEVRLKTLKRAMLKGIELELSDPPAGVTLGKTRLAPEGLVFSVKVDRDVAQAGLEDNLIVEVYRELPARSRIGKAVGKLKGRGSTAGSEETVKKTQRVMIGVLPAIPIEIVPQ